MVVSKTLNRAMVVTHFMLLSAKHSLPAHFSRISAVQQKPNKPQAPKFLIAVLTIYYKIQGSQFLFIKKSRKVSWKVEEERNPPPCVTISLQL